MKDLRRDFRFRVPISKPPCHLKMTASRLFLLHRSLPLLLSGMAMAAPDFVHEVAPILKKHCSECHTDTKKKAGLSMNDEASFREGSENGPIIDTAHPEKSLMLELISSEDEDVRMPPKGKGLSDPQVEVIKAWVIAGAKWEPGFAFKKPAYEPPLRPRIPELPAARDGRSNPIDRIIDHYLAEKKLPRPAPLDDTAFLRRVHLDLVGLLPPAETLRTFTADPAPDKRARLVDSLLADKTAYAEHWLTFWNDLLRNDYAGTGYIDGGRKQISGWLYQAIHDNMPYDEFVRQLVAPSAENEGFANGIKWRGNVSAAQITPMQYAQSVGQTFLGINLKCASCHDSFVDRWKLSEAYGLAAIYCGRAAGNVPLRQADRQDRGPRLVVPGTRHGGRRLAEGGAPETTRRAHHPSGKRPHPARHHQPSLAASDGTRHRPSRGCDAVAAVERGPPGLPRGASGGKPA